MNRKKLLYGGASIIPAAIGAGIAKVREEKDRWDKFERDLAAQAERNDKETHDAT